MYGRLIFLSTLLLISLSVSSTYGAAQSSELSCAITKGIYTSKAESGLKLTFHKIDKYPGWPSNVAIKVNSSKTGNKQWFLFEKNVSSMISLVFAGKVTQSGWSPPSHDSSKQFQKVGTQAGTYYAFNSSLNYIYSLPDAKSKAPYLILMPYLPDIFWTPIHPEHVTEAFFVLSKCK
jgi:hypothetical protein